MSETSEKIRSWIIGNSAVAIEELSDDDSLIQRSLIDSVGMLGLIGFLESEFGIKIRDEDVLPENFDSIQRISELVKSRSS